MEANQFDKDTKRQQKSKEYIYMSVERGKDK